MRSPALVIAALGFILLVIMEMNEQLGARQEVDRTIEGYDRLYSSRAQDGF